ncbi:1,4-dihydroxy-2-naphthoate octaprenyltransferase [subsurface metagenome]
MVLPVLRQFLLCVKSRMKDVLISYAWLSVIGLFITFRGTPPPVLLLKVFCAVTGMAFGMYLWNDVCDFKQDMVGKDMGYQSPSGRPLARGLVSKRRMKVFSALLVVLGLMASALINLDVLLIQIAFFIIYMIYSTEPMRLKRFFLWKQVTVAAGGAIACLSAGLAAGIISIQLLYLTGLYVLFIVGAHPLSDIRDIESDRAGGIKTIPVVWGPEFTIRLALTTFTAAAATTWIGFYGLGFNVALPIIGTIVFVAFVYVVYPLLSHLSDLEYMVERLYSRGMPLFFILQIAVLVGSLPL